MTFVPETFYEIDLKERILAFETSRQLSIKAVRLSQCATFLVKSTKTIWKLPFFTYARASRQFTNRAHVCFTPLTKCLQLRNMTSHAGHVAARKVHDFTIIDRVTCACSHVATYELILKYNPKRGEASSINRTVASEMEKRKRE